MDGEDNNPLPHIVLNERSQLQGLDSIHPGNTIIVKLEDSDDVTSQMFQAYTTSINHLDKDTDETEIAFEIIQEPLLDESGNNVENRLYFDPDYHPKENLQIVSIERGKEHEHLTLTTTEESQSTAITGYEVQEIGDPISSASTSKVHLAANSSSLSSLQNILTPVVATSTTSTADFMNLELLKHENDDNRKDPEIVKKTMVKAFVKMVVCRKITIQRTDAKTGDILDVEEKTEEEEPVVLDVDYVETTEDSITGNAVKTNSDSMKDMNEVNANSIGPETASAISENSSTISRRLFVNSLLQSALKKKIKTFQTDKDTSQSNLSSEKQTLQQSSDDRKDGTKTNSLSDSEWVEDFNDDSADYIPYPSSKSNVGTKSKKIHKEVKPSKFSVVSDSIYSSVHVKGGKDNNIHIPKKRGRKRKWDKTIGIASNMKTCQFCNKHFDTVSRCNKHMKMGNCVSSQFCFICSKNFDSEEQLEIHVSTHRSDNKISSYDCSDCKRSYRTKAGYLKHFRSGTCTKREHFEDGQSGDFSCELCNSKFSSLDYLQLHHYKVHENPKDRHVCPLCGKTFYSLQGFQRHRSARPCTEPLKCHICGKTYKVKESFKLHMKHHKSEITGITFNCDECGRSYMTEAALTKHKYLHTGVKPYKCNVCGKEFAMRYQVKDHARTHSGEKPFSCSICHVSFSDKGHLGRHLRSHENGTLFRRGRPKKIQDSESGTSSKSGETQIRLGQTLKTIDGQMIRVIDSGQILTSQGDAPPPMIIQADTNTIIIAEGWPENTAPTSQAVVVSNDESSVVSN